MPRRTSLVAVLCVAGLVGGLLPFAAPAPPARAAATFTVTATGDGGDDTPDGACDANPTRAVVECTLREAIQEANVTPGADTIVFDIFEATGSDLKTIRPASQLPVITEKVTVDGYTQPGASPNTATLGTNAVLKIELDGTNAGPRAAALHFFGAAGSLVRGLVINRFSNGIVVRGATTTGVRIAGCFIGTDATGTEARPNIRGVLVDGVSTVVGGTVPGARNLISGQWEGGVVLGRDADVSRVEGNLIGTDATGTAPLRGPDANIGSGVVVHTSDAVVGGTRDAAANVIAFNGFHGVVVGDPYGNLTERNNRILRNAIFANGNDAVGIDLVGGTQDTNSATANDPGDADAGPNNLQNTPMLTEAGTVGATTTIVGRLDSTPGRTFLVQFFANRPGGDEGETFIGQQSVTTDDGGTARFTFSPDRKVAVGKTITATATDPRGNTSEFSPTRMVERGSIGR